MDIVLICDRNYLVPTRAAVNSVLKNKLPEERITVHVVGSGLEEKDLDSFRELEDGHLTVRTYLPSIITESFQGRHTHVSKAALYKFYLPEILSGLDRVLYLDSDVVVTGSLGGLYGTDMADAYAAVVRDMIAETRMGLREALGVSMYFNSGMMLLNLDLLRRHNVSDTLWNVRQKDVSMDFMDQNVFNRVFDGKIAEVPLKYNYMQTLDDIPGDDVASFYGISVEAVRAARENPVVLHLTDREKPWNSIYARRADTWYWYVPRGDIFGIVHDMCGSVSEQLRIKSVMLEQEHENYRFIKEGGISRPEHVGLLEKRICAVGEQIHGIISKEAVSGGRIVIYGAGKFGMALYRCLWNMGLSQYIAGFAVNDINRNVGELYGKRVLCVEDYKADTDCVILVGVRDETGRVAEEIKEKVAPCRVIDLNMLLADRDGEVC